MSVPKPWPTHADAERQETLDLAETANHTLEEARRSMDGDPKHAKYLVADAQLDLERIARLMERAKAKN